VIRPLVDPAVLAIVTTVLLGVVVVGAVTADRAERSGWLLRGLMVALLAAIALRPGWGTVPAETKPSDLEVVVLVDRTTSMSALDWHGEQPRLEGVREDVSVLMSSLPSSRFTVVTFGRTVRTELPSTMDAALVDESLALIDTEAPFAGRGSALDRPLEALQELLLRMEEEHPERRQVVVLMSDGEKTAAEPQASFADLEPLVDAGVVLGYGTSEGGLMPLPGATDEGEWVIDPATGEPARSRFDGDNLRTVASELSVPFLQREKDGGLAELSAGWQQRFTVRSEDAGEARADLELGWLLAIALLIVTVVDLRRHWRQLWQARRDLA
jgi:Ca-activated chloride channel homolog